MLTCTFLIMVDDNVLSENLEGHTHRERRTEGGKTKPFRCSSSLTLQHLTDTILMKGSLRYPSLFLAIPWNMLPRRLSSPHFTTENFRVTIEHLTSMDLRTYSSRTLQIPYTLPHQIQPSLIHLLIQQQSISGVFQL